MAKAIEDLEVLRVAEQLADEIWREVMGWGEFERDTIGKQLVRAADLIGANIAESFGRYHYGEKLQFLYYARGSAYETKYWLNRALERQLFPSTTLQNLADMVGKLANLLNGFARHIRKFKQNQPATSNHTIRETAELPYDPSPTDLFTPTDITFLTSTQ